MDPVSSRIENLLESVLTVPPEQRPSFLRQACAGDIALEQQLQRLILGYERASALEQPIADIRAAVASTLAIGTVLDDKYEIIARLGTGGMGEVFKARHIHLDTIRCIKVMRKDLTAIESLRRRFVREGMAATRLHHPNVATVHDVSKLPDGSYYLVTEFIDGLTLRQWFAQHGRFAVPFAVEIAQQVLSGLEHCHSRGLLHRDISAENIMISTDASGSAVVKIIDLGIAKMITGPGADATREGLFVGNPRYSSPEQLGLLPEGGEIDARADLYCFGVVLYEMVAGTPPFTSTTPEGYAAKHLTQPVPSFAAVDPRLRIPPGFEAAVMNALEKDRRRRYPSARAFAEALRPYATTVPLATWVTMPANTPVPVDPEAATEPLLDNRAQTVPTDSRPTVIATPSPHGRKARLRLTAALIVVLMASIVAYVEWPRRIAIASRSPRARPPVAIANSILAIDALPWGEVNAIIDASGHNVFLSNGLHYTPLTISLPAGRYRVSITNPKRPNPLLLNAEVPKSGIATIQANFGPTEAADYFAKVAR